MSQKKANKIYLSHLLGTCFIFLPSNYSLTTRSCKYLKTLFSTGKKIFSFAKPIFNPLLSNPRLIQFLAHQFGSDDVFSPHRPLERHCLRWPFMALAHMSAWKVLPSAPELSRKCTGCGVATLSVCVAVGFRAIPFPPIYHSGRFFKESGSGPSEGWVISALLEIVCSKGFLQTFLFSPPPFFLSLASFLKSLIKEEIKKTSALLNFIIPWDKVIF